MVSRRVLPRFASPDAQQAERAATIPPQVTPLPPTAPRLPKWHDQKWCKAHTAFQRSREAERSSAAAVGTFSSTWPHTAPGSVRGRRGPPLTWFLPRTCGLSCWTEDYICVRSVVYGTLHLRYGALRRHGDAAAVAALVDAHRRNQRDARRRTPSTGTHRPRWERTRRRAPNPSRLVVD